MLRGNIVVENGAFSGDLKDGQFLARKVPPGTRSISFCFPSPHSRIFSATSGPPR
jgi:hypothetical protein